MDLDNRVTFEMLVSAPVVIIGWPLVWLFHPTALATLGVGVAYSVVYVAALQWRTRRDRRAG